MPPAAHTLPQVHGRPQRKANYTDQSARQCIQGLIAPLFQAMGTTTCVCTSQLHMASVPPNMVQPYPPARHRAVSQVWQARHQGRALCSWTGPHLLPVMPYIACACPISLCSGLESHASQSAKNGCRQPRLAGTGGKGSTSSCAVPAAAVSSRGPGGRLLRAFSCATCSSIFALASSARARLRSSCIQLHDSVACSGVGKPPTRAMQACPCDLSILVLHVRSCYTVIITVAWHVRSHLLNISKPHHRRLPACRRHRPFAVMGLSRRLLHGMT